MSSTPYTVELKVNKESYIHSKSLFDVNIHSKLYCFGQKGAQALCLPH